MKSSLVLLLSVISLSIASPLTYDIKGRRYNNKKAFTEVQEAITTEAVPQTTDASTIEESSESPSSDPCTEGEFIVGIMPPSDQGYSTVLQANPCTKTPSSDIGKFPLEESESDIATTPQEDQTESQDSYRNIKSDEEEEKVELPIEMSDDEMKILSRELQPPKVDATWGIMKHIPETTSEKLDEVTSTSSVRPSRMYVKGGYNRWKNNN